MHTILHVLTKEKRPLYVMIFYMYTCFTILKPPILYFFARFIYDEYIRPYFFITRCFYNFREWPPHVSTPHSLHLKHLLVGGTKYVVIWIPKHTLCPSRKPRSFIWAIGKHALDIQISITESRTRGTKVAGSATLLTWHPIILQVHIIHY